MSENSLSRHGADALKKFETTSNSSEFTKDNIWFDWGNKEEHVIRIVGDFRISRSHWIGESKFGNDVALLNSEAFKGDKKLPMTVACLPVCFRAERRNSWPMAKAMKPRATSEIIERESTCSKVLKPRHGIPSRPRTQGPISTPVTR